MSAHNHSERTPGCFRCEMTSDEIGVAMTDERVQYAMDLDHLRAVAEAATSGPWEWREGHARYLTAPDDAKVLHASSYEDHEDVQSSEADARHVATFDPPTVLALIAELERLHSWAGLMELLDEHWPDDIFPTLEDDPKRDAGARIVSLIRWVDRLKVDAEELDRIIRSVLRKGR